MISNSLGIDDVERKQNLIDKNYLRMAIRVWYGPICTNSSRVTISCSTPTYLMYVASVRIPVCTCSSLPPTIERRIYKYEYQVPVP